MELITRLSGALWSVPMVALISFTGIYIGIKGGYFRTASPKKVLKSALSGDKSSFEALCTALAGTVGTGNVIGVAVAIYFGGPGALFWMWVSALIGMAVKYAEALLAVKYRGGPMRYISGGLGSGFRWLAVIFAACSSLAALGVGNMVQIGAIAASFRDLLGDREGLQLAVGAAVALPVLIMSARESRGRALSFVVPFMAVFYLAGALFVVAVNCRQLPPALMSIIRGAARPEAAFWGFRRGIISNEAGVGSSPIAHAESRGKTPREEGYLGVFEVAFDTLFISTATGLMLLTSGTEAEATVWVTRALGTVLGGGAAPFVTAALTLFAFSSVVSWSFYGEKSAEFLFGRASRWPYRILFAATAMLSALMSFDAAIALSDLMNALMALPNLCALILLAPRVREETLPAAPPGQIVLNRKTERSR